MTTLRHRTPRRLPEPRILAHAGAAVMLAAAAVAAALWILAARPQDDRGAQDARSVTERVGGLVVERPAGWTRRPEAPPVPGFPMRSPVVLDDGALGTRMVIGILPAETPELLPAAVLQRLARPPAAAWRIRLDGDLRAYHYVGLVPDPRRPPIDVFAAPTSRGVVTAVCLSPPTVAATLTACEEIARGISDTVGIPLALGPDAAFRQRLATGIRALDRERAALRPALEDASTAAAQAGVLRRLAAAHERALRALTPLVPARPAWPRAVIAELERVARAHRELAAALGRGDAAARSRIRRDLERAEARLRRMLAGHVPT